MRNVLMAILAGLLLAGCGSVDKDISGLNSAEIAYVEWYETMQKELGDNPDYRELPFQTAKRKDQFDALLRDAYRGKIDRMEFTDRVSTAFPGYEDSVDLMVEHLPE